MRLRAFGFGNGTTSLRSGPGHVVRVRDLTRYLQGYLYITRGIYISLGVFIYPPRYLLLLLIDAHTKKGGKKYIYE